MIFGEWLGAYKHVMRSSPVSPYSSWPTERKMESCTLMTIHTDLTKRSSMNFYQTDVQPLQGNLSWSSSRHVKERKPMREPSSHPGVGILPPTVAPPGQTTGYHIIQTFWYFRHVLISKIYPSLPANCLYFRRPTMDIILFAADRVVGSSNHSASA